MEKFYLRALGVVVWMGMLVMPLWGQQTSISGTVSLNEMGGAPIASVRIHARGANAVLTNPNGTFELVFVDKMPGDKIRLHIEKSGLEVVNTEVLRLIIPAGDSEKLEIVMCKSGERDRYAHTYYHISIEKILEKKYREELEKIMKDDRNGLDTDAITRLTEERNQALEEAEEMAKALALVDLEEVSVIYNTALFYYNTGEKGKVQELLSDQLLELESQKLAEMSEKVQEARLHIMQSYILKANAYFQANRVEEAFQYFERAKSMDSALFHDLIAPESVGANSDMDSTIEKESQASADSIHSRASLSLITGIVKDATTGRTVRRVSVTCCGGLEDRTDRRGRFFIFIPTDRQHPTQQAFFDHEKYISSKRIFLLDGSVFDIFLQPK